MDLAMLEIFMVVLASQLRRERELLAGPGAEASVRAAVEASRMLFRGCGPSA
jgi:hypothetical protein